MKKNKKEIKEYTGIYISYYDMFEGSLESVSKEVLGLRERAINESKYIEENIDKIIRFEIEMESSYDEIELKLVSIRLETNEEYDKRIKKEENAKLTRIALEKKKRKEKIEREKELYLKLQKKYLKS